MKYKNVIKSAFKQQEKKESMHIKVLEKQILSRIQEEKELDQEARTYFPRRNSFWTGKLPYAFAVLLLFVLFFGISTRNPVMAKGSIFEVLINLRNQLQQELTNLLFHDPSFRDKETQKYKRAYHEWCSVSARSPEEHEIAVAAIRDFLDKPDINVEYECIVKNPNNDSKPRLETFIVGLDRFTIDIKTNRVIEMSPKEGEWGQKKDGSIWLSPQKQYDYTPRFTQVEVEQIARNFISTHEKALGKIDLDKSTLETGMKDDEAGKVNYFFIWKGEPQEYKLDKPTKICGLDVDKEKADSVDSNGIPCVTEKTYTPRLIIAYTQGGELINFSNELIK